MKERSHGLLALLLLTLVWGYSWVLIKLAVGRAGPFILAADRAFVAALALFALLKLLGRPLRPAHPGGFLLLGLIQTTLFLSLQGAALVTGGAGKTAVLVYTMPIWTMLLSGLLLGEHIRPTQAAAGVLALGGLALVISPWSLNSSPIAQGLALAASLAWSAGTILIKRLNRKAPLDVLNLNAWQCLLGSIALMPVAALMPGHRPMGDPSYLGLVLAIGVLVTALGWGLWSYVLKHLPAWQASLAVLGVPVVALATSRWQMGEAMDAAETAGIALIAAGLSIQSFLAWLSERRRR